MITRLEVFFIIMSIQYIVQKASDHGMWLVCIVQSIQFNAKYVYPCVGKWSSESCAAKMSLRPLSFKKKDG